MTVAQQVTTAVHLAQSNRLTNVHVHVRFRDEVRNDFAVKPLDEADLRGIEVWITEGDGYIYGIVGDQLDGPKNVVLTMPYKPEQVAAQRKGS